MQIMQLHFKNNRF